MKIYIVQVLGRSNEDPGWFEVRQIAFTKREAAEAEKDAFLESVKHVFYSGSNIDVEVIELEVK